MRDIVVDDTLDGCDVLVERAFFEWDVEETVPAEVAKLPA